MELEIQETVLHREDNAVMNIYGVTQEQDIFYEIKKASDVSQNAYYRTRFELRIKMNKDTTIIHRNIYNVFTLLGDIGGFYVVSFSLAAAFLNIINHSKPENILGSKLF